VAYLIHLVDDGLWMATSVYHLDIQGSTRFLIILMVDLGTGTIIFIGLQAAHRNCHDERHCIDSLSLSL